MAEIITSTPVIHYVSLWMKPEGGLWLGKRYKTLQGAQNAEISKDDPLSSSNRLCVLKVTTTVEVA